MSSSNDRIPNELLALVTAAEPCAEQTRAGMREGTLIGRPSVEDLAREVEELPEYEAFRALLSGREGPDSGYSRSVLRRTGFFAALLRGEDAKEIWGRVHAYRTSYEHDYLDISLLDGIHLPSQEYSIGKHRLRRFTEDELSSLGPGAILGAHFPHERLDAGLAEYWWLVEEGRHQVKAGYAYLPRYWGDEWVLGSWEPLTVLATFRLACFRVPVRLRAEPGWKIERHLYSEPERDLVSLGDEEPVEVPAQHFQVREEEELAFQSWLADAPGAIALLRAWKPFRMAAQRFIRSTLLSDPDGGVVWDSPRFEQVFLWYLYSLDGILAFDGGGHRDKIATRAAILISSDDEDRRIIRKYLIDAYDLRSKVAHGSELAESIDLRSLRDLVRRVLAMAIALAGVASGPDQVRDAISDLAISDQVRESIEERRTRIEVVFKGDLQLR